MEKGSIVDAQVTLDEEQQKEIERCKDWKYYYITYWRIVKENGILTKPNIIPDYILEQLRKGAFIPIHYY